MEGYLFLSVKRNSLELDPFVHYENGGAFLVVLLVYLKQLECKVCKSSRNNYFNLAHFLL